MSIESVLSKDFTSVQRSGALWATGVCLALVAYVNLGPGAPPVREAQNAYGLLVGLVGVLVPIVAIVASYMAITGERASGGIKFLLAFPNSRRDVFVGKLVSRLAVVGAVVLFMFVAGDEPGQPSQEQGGEPARYNVVRTRFGQPPLTDPGNLLRLVSALAGVVVLGGGGYLRSRP